MNCGNKNEDNAKFCISCGAPMGVQNSSPTINQQPNLAPQYQQATPFYSKPKKRFYQNPVIVAIICVFCVIIGLTILSSIAESVNPDETSILESEPTDSDASYKNNETTTEPTKPTEPTEPETEEPTVDPAVVESEYKQSCQSISYEEIARDANGFKGQYFTFTGQVLQEIGYGDYRLGVTADEFGYYYDDVIVFHYNTGDGDRILEDDMITIWGVSDGLKSYETILGESVKIPRIDVEYIQFN